MSDHLPNRQDTDFEDNTDFEGIIAQYMIDCEQGKVVDRDALVAAHPAQADLLREFFATDDAFFAAALEARHEMDAQQCREDNPSNDSSENGSPSSQRINAPKESHSTLRIPKEFGEYEVIEEIDRGGMGIVLKARHRRLGRTVALKIIRSGELANHAEEQRFESEAQAAATLNHPGIIPIFEVGQHHGMMFYTMAFIEGRSLVELVQHGPLDPAEAAKILIRLCEAIQYAHEQGVTHRDLKPANVLLNQSGLPIIIDFGLAKVAHRDSNLTATGQLLGTPAYMAPECARSGASAGPGSDVYALGAILYFLCAGQAPFTGPTPFDVLLQVLDREPPLPSKLNKRVNHRLDYICQKSIAKDPADRYASAQELHDDLQKYLRGEPIDIGKLSWLDRLESWWKREPILVAHVCGIGLTTFIVAISHWIRDQPSNPYPYRMGLLLLWLAASFALQFWVIRAKWRDAACLTWAVVDVTLYTTLIAFADRPSPLLLIGYPMMVAASSLFYRSRFVLFMTGLCIGAFLILSRIPNTGISDKIDYAAIYLCGLCVISLCLLAMIRRVRALSIYHEN